jgi:hypothetical protein
MNFPYLIPGSQTDPSAFVANNTLRLGAFSKPLDARTLVSVDYSQLTPAVVLSSYSFRVRPGGEPQLWIDASAITGSPVDQLAFYVHGGMDGRSYNIDIIANLVDTEIRVDSLTVNVYDDGYSTYGVIWGLPPSVGGVTGDGTVVINTAPRFFVSATPPVGANVLDRWYNTTTHIVSDYITNGVTASWATTGGASVGSVAVKQMQPIVPDGTTQTFTLTASDLSVVNVTDPNQLFVSLDGVWQQPVIMFTAGGTTITFATAPTADAYIFMLWFAPE